MEAATATQQAQKTQQEAKRQNQGTREPTPSPQQSEPTPSPTTDEKKATEYVVLGGAHEEGPFAPIGQVSVESGGQREARRLVAMSDQDTKDCLGRGETVFLVAVPASSWKPTPIKVETTQRLVV